MCHEIAPLRMFMFTFSRLEALTCEYIENGESQGKCSSMTFIEVDLFHRVEPLRMLKSRTLSFIFKDKPFLVMHCYKKMHRQRMSQTDLP